MKDIISDINKMKEYLVPLDIGHKLARFGPRFEKSKDGSFIWITKYNIIITHSKINKIFFI